MKRTKRGPMPWDVYVWFRRTWVLVAKCIGESEAGAVADHRNYYSQRTKIEHRNEERGRVMTIISEPNGPV